MKFEARILVSKCSQDVCLSAILRGRALDAVVIARGCEDLCGNLKARGYFYELRYHVGDCSCNLPEPPRTPGIAWDLVVFLERLGGALEKLKLIRVELESSCG